MDAAIDLPLLRVLGLKGMASAEIVAGALRAPDHAARIAGHDHVGIGGDLDGIDRTVTGLDGVEDYPALFAELIRRGWNDRDLAKLAGGNILRVMRQAEQVAESMEDEPPSMATLNPAR